MNWYLLPWKRFAEFEGRSRRKEYWTFQLVNLLVFCLLYVASLATMRADESVGIGIFVAVWIFSLAQTIPALACGVRRLHDTGKSGWWLLISFIPVVGGVILLVYFFSDGEHGPNRFGADPKRPELGGPEPADQTAAPTQRPELTPWQILGYTFWAPSKAFEDIRRGNRSWWLPLILLMIFSYLFFGVVQQKVGMPQVVENQFRMSPKAQERVANQTPEQRAVGEKIGIRITEVAFLAGPVLGLIGALVVSLGLWGTINFIFGGRATFGQIFTVSYYAWLPSIVKVLLGIAALYAGMAPESFNIKNFAPTNLAALLMDPGSTSPALYSLASSVDIVTIWLLVLMSIGVATVAGVKRSAGYLAVFGWWAIFALLGAGLAAVFS